MMERDRSVVAVGFMASGAKPPDSLCNAEIGEPRVWDVVESTHDERGAEGIVHLSKSIALVAEKG